MVDGKNASDDLLRFVHLTGEVKGDAYAGEICDVVPNRVH